MHLFTDDMRRDPFRTYAQLRQASPIFHVAAFDLWMVFDFESVRRVLADHEAFSSDLSHIPGQGNPGEWFIFFDPPRHAKLRALISKAFTGKIVADLQPRITALSNELLDAAASRETMDLAADFSVPLPMRVIAELLGMPAEEWPRYRRWSDSILKVANTFMRDAEAAAVMTEFRAVKQEMAAFLPDFIARKKAARHDDLLTRLATAQVDGQRLTEGELLGFVQLLLVAGQETTANLINNAVLCLMEYPEQLAKLRASPALLPAAIEEVLRFRSPVQWMPRATRRDVELRGITIPAAKLVMPMIGSANRDESQFPNADHFDIARPSSAHLAFGHGIHACLGAPLARLEARIAITDFLQRAQSFELAEQGPWQPRQALHVHGPSRLPLRVTWAKQ